MIGDRVNHFIPNPTFDPIIEPGCLDLLFRGEIPEGVDPASLMKVERLASHPEYQNRDARVTVMDTQGIETVFMLPTFACGVEEALKHDIEATMASVHAFNLWLDEDWGFDRPDHRIIAAPIISLADPAKALEEVEFVLARGAKLVLVRPAPVPGVVKPRSLGDPIHDPVWARAGRGGGTGGLPPQRQRLPAHRGAVGRQVDLRGVRREGSAGTVLLDDRAIHDTMASMIVHGVFTRHPKLRAVSIENGSYFVHRLIKRLKKAANNSSAALPRGSGGAAAQQRLDRSLLRGRSAGAGRRSSASTRSCSVRTGRTAKAWRRRCRSPRSSAASANADIRKVMRDNALDLLGVKVGSAVLAAHHERMDHRRGS